MVVTATEFQSDVSRYLAIVDDEDIVIAANGRNVAKLSGIRRNKVDIAKSLFGVIPNSGATLTALREERLARYENID